MIPSTYQEAACHLGRHIPHKDSDKIRYPVYLKMQAAKEYDAESANQPQPIPYFTVRWCVKCGLEEKTAHNFEWKDVESL